MATSFLLGQKDLIGSDRTQALINTAPAEEWYWTMMYVSDAAYTNGTLVTDIEITYDVILFDRQDLDHSLEGLFDQVHAQRCKLLSDAKQPYNKELPVNRAKAASMLESKSNKPPPQCDIESDEDVVQIRVPRGGRPYAVQEPATPAPSVRKA
jgi:hypothetical protein